jgi:cobalt-zinc-cadmium efflux system membrane fusion protein
MFATAAIQTGRAGKAILVPEDAVVLVQGVPTVFVEDADGFEPRVVEVGEKLRGRVAIKNGIKSGDLVVVAGAYALKARMLKSQIGEGHAH